MNEIFDKLIIRILFTIFICLAIWGYRYIHVLFFPSQKKQFFNKVYPLENQADTLHVFSRLLGLSIIFSSMEFNEHSGVLFSVLHFVTWSFLSILLYLLSLYITESIIFPKFTYADEILKKKNLTYATVNLANAVSVSFLIKSVISESEESLIISSILWLFILSIYGIVLKFYRLISALQFEQLMIQKNLNLAYSFSGFIMAATIVLISSFNHEHHELVAYMIQTVLKILLAMLIFPIFRVGLTFIYKIDQSPEEAEKDIFEGHGIGVYEGVTFLSSGFLTSIVIGQIHFGTIYPIF